MTQLHAPIFHTSLNLTLVVTWQKSTPPRWGKKFWHQIYPFQAILSNFWFLWQKRPPPEWGNFFDIRSIHFKQFPATLGFCGRKAPPLPPGCRKFFWHRIYPFQAILSNFGFCGRKAPPPRMRENFLTLDLSISGNFEQLWFLWQNTPPQDEGNFFDIRSIHFRQFWATLVFVAERPPLQDEENFLTSDLSISGNFQQLWFLWQKSPPFLPFHHGPGLCHIGRIPKIPIPQIHTQIPPIWISSIGYQLCQLFKILTYTELQNSGSWCIWKAYRQSYHNTH